MNLQITFYTKPNCSLCEEAEELLEEMKDLFGFSIFKVNIIKNMSTYEKYKNQIPVIDLGGRYYFSGKISRKELKQKIRALVKK